jgi:hypothetical protein
MYTLDELFEGAVTVDKHQTHNVREEVVSGLQVALKRLDRTWSVPVDCWKQKKLSRDLLAISLPAVQHLGRIFPLSCHRLLVPALFILCFVYDIVLLKRFPT